MLRLEHVGLAVRDADAARATYAAVVDALSYKSETVAEQGVTTHFMAVENTKLELLEALGEDSPVHRFLERQGEGVHHLAFEVPDIDDAFERMTEAGFTPLSDTPLNGADGKRIFFLHPKSTHGVLIECCSGQPVMPDPAYADTPAGAVAYYTWGNPNRPTLLLLHGAAGSTETETHRLVRYLEPCLHVVALDFIGHGASANASPSQPLTPELFAQNAQAVLDDVGVSQAHVFGFSMGGNMALQLAHDAPDRVARVMAHGAHIDWTTATVDAMTRRLDRADAQTDRMDALHGDWEALAEALRIFIEQLPGAALRLRRQMQTVRQPVLVSMADADDLFPLQAALTLHNALPNSRLAILPGDHHALQHQRIAPLANQMRAFLAPSEHAD
ncbi:methylmalonyl-CoA epimerase [Longimonas halophila]|uniref:Methylmalonyl-CoA epimerase n=1 Tax=Longimonas halophila TaxID=1469170 RepID=A0A2H3P1A0_9BACT|nr:methylmalonyl-CoA epimerase [Longimonas halophila]PEN09350.1 methylmalonyl-CoA epimerase [Longimonas halophila]